MTSAAIAEPFIETVAILGIVAFPLFYVIWRYVFPQPYESLTLRLIGSAILVPLALRRHWPERLERCLPAYWLFMVLYCLIFFFSYFFLRNNLSVVWMLSLIASTFLLTFFVDWLAAILVFCIGTLLGWGYYLLAGSGSIEFHEYLQYLVIFLFPLTFGSVINHQLQHYRSVQASFEKRIRQLSELNTRIVQEQNELLSRFLSNSIVARLRKQQKRHGLDTAISLITRQEKKFCGIMQADIRNFTKMFGHDTEVEVARLVRRCFSDISDIGQDIAVLKPVGDCMFVYCDDEFGQDTAVRNILALAVVFVNSVERINTALEAQGEARLNFGIGVHAGEVIYGNLASDNLIDPTIIGVNVNKTARLEELTKFPAIPAIAGNNAIILSEQIKAMADPFISSEAVLPIDLASLNIGLRDFDQDRTVYAITQEVAREYYKKASEHITVQRSNSLTSYGHVDKYSHKGFSYFYEMQGNGADTSWSILIDLHHFPVKRVASYAARHLAELDYQITDTGGTWLVLSTKNFAGEFDEIDVENRIVEIIEDLQQLSAS